jgi:hypothetical protein
MSDKKLQIIPLGGLGEFGMNCMAVRYGDDIIVLDAGMMFPDAELMGVDIVTPDFTYLEDNAEHVRGLILTHGHEDHIGGIPFLLALMKIPVYGTAFTLALVERRLEEHEMLREVNLNKVKAGETLVLGPFSIEFIQGGPVAHRQRIVRSAQIRRVRQARRAAADVGFDQRRPVRLHGERARSRAAIRRAVYAGAAENRNLLFQLLHSPAATDSRRGA